VSKDYILPPNEQYAGARQDAKVRGQLPQQTKIPQGTERNRQARQAAWERLQGRFDKLPPRGNPNYDFLRPAPVLEGMYPGWPLQQDRLVKYPGAEPALEHGLLSEMFAAQGLPRHSAEKVVHSPDPGGDLDPETTMGYWQELTKKMWLNTRPEAAPLLLGTAIHEVDHAANHVFQKGFKGKKWPKGTPSSEMFDEYGQMLDHFAPGTPGNRGRAEMLEGQAIVKKHGGGYPRFFLDRFPQMQGQELKNIPKFSDPSKAKKYPSFEKKNGRNPSSINEEQASEPANAGEILRPLNTMRAPAANPWQPQDTRGYFVPDGGLSLEAPGPIGQLAPNPYALMRGE